MEETSLTTRREGIDKFVNDKSVLGLVDLILSLDTIQPYVALSVNGEVGEFLQEKGISVVHNKKEFDYLYESLKNRITSLEGKEPIVKTYIQRAEYQKQLADIPLKLSKLEQTVNSGFENLEEPFKAVLNYVWEAVVNNGFHMEEENPEIKIRKDIGPNDEEGLSIDIEKINFNAFKERTILEEIERKGKVLGIFERTIFEKVEKKENAERGDFFIDLDYRGDYKSVKEYIQSLKRDFVNYKEKQAKISSDIKYFLRLPKRINEYIEEEQNKVAKMINGFNIEDENRR